MERHRAAVGCPQGRRRHHPVLRAQRLARSHGLLFELQCNVGQPDVPPQGQRRGNKPRTESGVTPDAPSGLRLRASRVIWQQRPQGRRRSLVMAIYQTGAYRVKPEFVAKVKRAIEEFVAYLQANEPGTQMYLAWQEKEHPPRFVHLFIFADAAAHARHGQSEAVKRFEAAYSPEL